MPSTTSSTNTDLLRYEPKHGVLICRECKYAIQKSALDSHLLRHKIYRGERQRLLSSIARLDVLEPDDVQLPVAGLPPVDGLPVISGFRCTSPGCESLYASSKRMRRHWSEAHGVSDPPESCTRLVNLQTFFRGTKLRYFEVSGPVSTPSPPPPTNQAQAATASSGSDDTGNGTGGNLASAAAIAALPACKRPPGPAPLYDPGLGQYIDLDTLKYFHHFTTNTSLTIPTENHSLTNKRWQVDVVQQAFQSRWLMCGLLTLAACHISCSVSGPYNARETARRGHLDRAVRWLREFSTGWGDIKTRDGGAGILGSLEEAKTGAQMILLQRCCHWTGDDTAPFNLRSFMRTIRGIVCPVFALCSTVSSDDLPEELVPEQNPGTVESEGRSAVNRPPPTEVVNHIKSLSMRMSDALGKPDSALDFFATLSAVDALVDCCGLSYKEDTSAAVWLGLETWLRRVSEHFLQMVARRKPAALVVLAHWSLLLERAEGYCWFLVGLTEKLRTQIVKELPDDASIQSLVEGMPDATAGTSVGGEVDGTHVDPRMDQMQF